MAILSMNDIRKGKVISLENEPYIVVSAEFLRKQQRRPVVRSVLKHLRTGQSREHSFQQADKVPEAEIAHKQYQYLYQNGEAFAFMDTTTYEQIELPAATLGDSARYLLEGQVIDIVLYQNSPVTVELPIKIERKVTEAPPGVRGDTSSNVMKEVTIEGGVKVKAPLFIAPGDTIVIDTRDGRYVQRA